MMEHIDSSDSYDCIEISISPANICRLCLTLPNKQQSLQCIGIRASIMMNFWRAWSHSSVVSVPHHCGPYLFIRPYLGESNSKLSYPYMMKFWKSPKTTPSSHFWMLHLVKAALIMFFFFKKIKTKVISALCNMVLTFE